jgi:transposase
MKIALKLSDCERETLFELSVNHRWRDARARGLLLLDEGKHPREIAQQCGVSRQSLQLAACMGRERVGGLLGGHVGGRPPKLAASWLKTVTTLARQEALSLGQIAQRAEEIHGEPFPCSLGRLSVALKANAFSFKRTRMSLKKTRLPAIRGCCKRVERLEATGATGEMSIVLLLVSHVKSRQNFCAIARRKSSVQSSFFSMTG